MELILWRHAEAAEGSPDLSRALTAKGHRQAERMASFLVARIPHNTRVLASPAVRAQQTAAALTSHFDTLDALAPNATPQQILKAINWPNAGGAVLVVGHQPWLGEVAAHLLAGRNDYWSIKKGAAWWLSRRDREGDFQTVLRLAISPDML